MGSFSAGLTKEQVEQLINEKTEPLKDTLRRISAAISRIEDKQNLTLDDIEPIKRMANEWNQEE